MYNKNKYTQFIRYIIINLNVFTKSTFKIKRKKFKTKRNVNVLRFFKL